MAFMATHSAPSQLIRRGNRILRPRDAASLYPNPRPEVARLVGRGALRRLAHGYYVAPPDDQLGDPDWRPAIEAVALGIAQADYGRDGAALMGPSAARVQGAIPRALATGLVAIPVQRPLLATAHGRVRFVKRDLARLDTVRVVTELAQGWATSAEQTILDLADRPLLGGITIDTASEAIGALALRADWSLVVALAGRQRKPAALARARWLGSAAAGRALPGKRPRRQVPSLGLRPVSDLPAGEFGIVP